jgi:uncharacterized protein YjiS (DUF1127 family)
MHPLGQEMLGRTTANFPQAKSSFFRIAVAKITTAIERRRIRAALGRLDNYMLKDLGIARSDIERIANRSYPPR